MLIFANPQSVFNGVLFLVAIFTVMGFISYLILTRDNTVRPKFRDGFGRSILKISRHSAFLIIFPVWLTACIWVYQSQLARKFYGLEPSKSKGNIVWEFSYYHPHRLWNRYHIIRVSAGNVLRWHVVDDWSGKSLKSALIAENRDGTRYQSLGVHRRLFQNKYDKQLEEWGVTLE